jgi:predicted transcriptional regulator
VSRRSDDGRLTPGVRGRVVYHLDEEERADIREGLAEIDRGEVASEDEVRATFADLLRK